jgi:uncharacterized RDD family membrane protein YckC
VSITAGWYPDPAEPDTQRYWDGEQWVGERLPLGAVPPSGPLVAPAAPAAPPPYAVPQPAPAPAPAGGDGTWGTPPPQPSTGWGAPGPAVPGAPYILAPLTERLAARLIDSLVLLGLNVVVNGYFVVQLVQEMGPLITAMQAGQTPVPTDRANSLVWAIQVIAAALWFAYEVPAIAGSGQTLGKRIVGLRVVSTSGEPIGFGRSFQRWMIPGLPTILGVWALPVQLLDAAWCLWDRPNRQCLHDRAAGTVVVTAPASPPGPGHP